MRFLFILIFVICEISTSSQTFKSNFFSQQIPNETYQVFCDSKGFIWIGHSNGLTRFDGNSFQHYTNKNQNSLGISNICEDARGNIWCRNFGGQIFFIKDNVLQLLSKYDWQSQATFPNFFITKDKILIASHQKGLFVYDIENNKSYIIPIPSKGILLNYCLNYLNNKILVIDNKNIYELSLYKTWKKVNTITKTSSTLTDYIILQGQTKNKLFIINNKVDSALIFKWNNCNLIEEQKIKIPKNVYNIYNLNDTAIWICSKSLTYNLLNNLKISDSVSITSLAKDKFNNVWYSSLNNGIGNFNQITSHKTNKTNKILESLNSQSIEVVDSILVSAEKNNYIAFVKNNNKFLVKNLINEPITVLHKSQKYLYAGGTYLYKIDTKSKRVDTIIETSSVKDIDVDLKGNIYVANAYSLMKILTSKEKIFVSNKRCKAVKVDKINNIVYGAFANGLFAFCNKSSKEILFNNQSIFTNSLIISNDTLVASTISNEILFIVKNKVIKQLNFQQHQNEALNIKLKYYYPNFYLLTSKQILEFNIEGIKNIYSNSQVENLIKATDFCLYNSTILTSVNQQLLTLNATKITQAPIVYLDNVSVNNININSLKKLNHKQNNLTFYFSALTLQQGTNFNYLYRLTETDTSFIPLASNKHSISFNSLQPGTYCFQIKAIDYWGNKSNVINYNFTINKPWWQTIWFIILSVFVFIIIGYIIARYIFKSQQQKNILLLEKLNLENNLRDSLLTAIKSQMNPHFIFNALNTIQSYIYTKDEDKASNYLGKFSDLIRLILDHSQKKTISLAKEIETLRLYTDLEMMRFENSLTVKYKIDENLFLDSIQIPTMLIQPYVENAIKHGLLHKQDNRILNIEFLKLNHQNQLLIVVEDNGIGIKASQEKNKIRLKQHNSFASFANANRLVLLNQTLKDKIKLKTIDKFDENKFPSGTRIEIYFPI